MSNESSLKFVPEYEESRAIIYSFSDVPLRSSYDSGYFQSPTYMTKFIDERMKMYKTIVEGLPKVEHIFLISKRPQRNEEKLKEFFESIGVPYEEEKTSKMKKIVRKILIQPLSKLGYKS